MLLVKSFIISNPLPAVLTKTNVPQIAHVKQINVIFELTLASLIILFDCLTIIQGLSFIFDILR